jgi:hypothetical protein
VGAVEIAVLVGIIVVIILGVNSARGGRLTGSGFDGYGIDGGTSGSHGHDHDHGGGWGDGGGGDGEGGGGGDGGGGD